MKHRNMTPLILSALLIGLIAAFSVRRMKVLNIWPYATLNFDIIFTSLYVVWMLYEAKVSKRELSQGDRTSDFGTCELYAMGQAGVVLSALWCDTFWQGPNVLHLCGVLVFISGVLYRLWAVVTLGKYYSHVVRQVEDHQIVDRGPYALIRHPAYTGMLVANVGIVVFFLNTITILIFFFFLIPAIVLRILVEEKTLFRMQGYAEFAATRKRLIPGAW